MAERSRAYPGVPLDECIENTRRIRREIGAGAHDRATIAKALGVSAPTAIRPVAAMVHFGLLTRERGGYSMSEFGKAACDPLDGELESVLRHCIRMPALYSELIDHFEGEMKVPERLSTVLHRNFGITMQAADLAAEVFLRSAKYAGLIDDNLRFRDRTLDPRAQAQRVVGAAGRASGISTVVGHADVSHNGGLNQRFVFRLSGGSAELTVPGSLTAKDLRIIKKQIELLELQNLSDATGDDQNLVDV